MLRRFRLPGNPTSIVIGPDATSALASELDALGARRALVLSTPGREPDAKKLAASIGERAAGVLATAKEHVPIEHAREARLSAKAAGADALVALGGGSTIGLAKAIALEHPARIVVVPTTYSGSEMTPIWGLSEAGTKRTGRDERVRAAAVLYDPGLTLALPASIGVPSAFNALAHSVEALYAADAQATSLLLAELGARAIAESLPEIVRRPSDIEARERALYGACLSAASLGGASMGLHHKLCHVLGGSFGLPHAPTHAVLLPHVARLNLEVAPLARIRLGRALGTSDPAEALFALAEQTGAPRDLESLGLSPDALERVVELMGEIPYPNPRTLTRAELRELLEAAYRGRKSKKPSEFRGPEAGRVSSELQYIPGFSSPLESEALPGALPREQNSPRRTPYGLYPELVSGTPFTVRRAENRRVWLYKIRPSLVASEALPLPVSGFGHDYLDATPNKLRWRPLPVPDQSRAVDFIDGLFTLGGYGAPGDVGYAVHLYAMNASMAERCLSDNDGDLLLLPEHGRLECRTEQGVLEVAPGELLLIARGLKFSLALRDKGARGYVLEVFGRHLDLPERGLIGSNGLADARHFLAPTAAYEDRPCPGYQIVTKLDGKLYASAADHSPFDVVAWHGNYAPYKYDLKRFNAMGSVTFDHPDPSILTLLSAAYDDHGRAVADFVLFPPRWEVSEHTFRPPFHHRNAATELNGVLRNPASPDGFEPGCMFLTPLLTPHGVSTRGYEAALEEPEAPRRGSDDSLWFMFESSLPFRPTRWALETPLLDAGFAALFSGVRTRFDPTRP